MTTRTAALPTRPGPARRALVPALAAALAAAFAGCIGPFSPLAERHGERVYTQVSLWVDGDAHLTTNYRRGWFVPINTQVEILGSSGDRIDVRILETGREFTIVNEESYSRAGIEAIYVRYFGASRVDLGAFDAETRDAIRGGTVREGLSKEAVLLARGFPPAHRTNAPVSNTWYYWVSRLDKRRIEFEDGKVARIED